MTAIKKSSKSTKSPTPATSSAAPAKRAAKKTATAGTNGGTPAAAIAVPAPVPAGAAPTPVVKPVAAKPASTTITARVDVGFGNALFLRGEGPGLSWDKGVPMDCIASDQWQIALAQSERPFAVKFLINDTTWSTGPDYIVPPGVNVTLAPQF